VRVTAALSDDANMRAAIAALFVYPVKSCRGIAAREATVTERGLQNDREWLIVDSSDRFVTQREVPQLALVLPSLAEHALRLDAPGMPSFDVAYDIGGDHRSVTIFRDTLPAIDQGDNAARWLSSYLQRAVRLVRFDAALRRYCNKAYAGETGAHTAFADGYPILVIGESSLADLNTRLDVALPMNRFRPNIVLSGVEAYDEDHVDTLECGKLTLKLVKPCVRCQITTTDQATAVVGIEPLPTLGTYRRNDALEGVMFGMNAIVAAGAGGRVHVGDRVTCAFKF
jgi:uncharacterized protein YcbX